MVVLPKMQKWMRHITLGYRALNPHPGMNAIGLEGWGWSYYKNYQYLTWDNGIPSESYSTNLEICPEGYHRPNDGSITPED